MYIPPPAAVVGLEKTFYSVLENASVVRVCAVVVSPSSTCAIRFPFAVNISASNKSGIRDFLNVVLKSTILYFQSLPQLLSTRIMVCLHT